MREEGLMSAASACETWMRAQNQCAACGSGGQRADRGDPADHVVGKIVVASKRRAAASGRQRRQEVPAVTPTVARTSGP